MNKTLFPAALLSTCLTQTLHAADTNSTTTGNTYTVLDGAFCNETNHVTYDGLGTFSVQSEPTTEIDVTISLSALEKYLATNDYTPSYFVSWNYTVSQNISQWGLYDTSTGITGWWNGNTHGDTVTYETLKQKATGDTLTLTITNDPKKGTNVNDGIYIYAGGTEVWKATELFNSYATATTSYTVNTNYVTSITIKTPSTLDTSNWEEPVILKPFESQRTDGTSVGRIMFVGDSITHGIQDATWRWHLFKTFTDNGIENEIAGPLKGFDNRNQYAFTNERESITHNSLSIAYGKEVFDNLHLAQSSGRAYEIINDTNSRYSGISTEEAALQYNANTYITLIGTNDLLSDTKKEATETTWATQMGKLLGGTVSYDTDTATYSWVAGEGGNLTTLAKDLLNETDDVLYLMTIPSWGDNNGTHGTNDIAREAVSQYNKLLKDWVDNFNNGTNTGTIKLIDINNGLVDKTTNKLFSPDCFFNTTDGLHPNDQGSLIIAGNLAKGMGIGGRTAGLARADRNTADTNWSTGTIGNNGIATEGTTYLLGENAFTEAGGYTVDFRATYGNGSTDGWLSSTDTLSISIGDGINSGTLNLSEGYIMWGTDVLFCADTSALDENLRIAWHNGNSTDNVLDGYYVWLGDMLIGQGLEATTGTGLNGIAITSTGADGKITDLNWSNTAYAPTTTGTQSATYSYITQQDAGNSSLVNNNYVPPMPTELHNNLATVTTSNVDFSNAQTLTSNSSASLASAATATTNTKIINLSSAVSSSWVSIVADEEENNVSVQVTGQVTNNIFGTAAINNNAASGTITLDITKDANIGTGKYDNLHSAIAGSFGMYKPNLSQVYTAEMDAFKVYINGGTVGGDIVGGSCNGKAEIGEVLIVVNSGTISGTIYGGNRTGANSITDPAEATVGKSTIEVNGGTITGGIVAGGSNGTVGDVNVTINGGIIRGNISKGAATRTDNATTNVTVVGTKALIGGNIEADTVTLRDIGTSGYSDGFDQYAGIITADTLVLDNVSTELETTVNVKGIDIRNASDTSLIMGDTATLEALTLGAETTFGAFKAAGNREVSTASETTLTLTTLTVGKGATLNANIVLGAESTLRIEEALTMGSSVELSSGMVIDLSADLLTQFNNGATIAIFESVDSLTLDGIGITTDTFTETQFTIAEQLQNVSLGYNKAGTVSITLIPEPTTATLSLLALAALAARRRR